MIGINPAALRGSLTRGRTFVNGFRLTFTNLLDGSDAVYEHYGRPYNSNYWLLDRNGDRVGNRQELFSVSRAGQKLDSLD